MVAEAPARLRAHVLASNNSPMVHPVGLKHVQMGQRGPRALRTGWKCEKWGLGPQNRADA